MAVNKSALDALNSLATGGSSGLDAYKQAQQKEANSRTQALQGALGGNDVYDAAMKSTAQFAPKVEGTGFQDAGNLLPAANQYLSEAANRIASENYVSHLKDTAKNRDAQLLGASEVMANQQRDALVGQMDQKYGTKAIDDLIAQRHKLEADRAAMNVTGPNSGDGSMLPPDAELVANEQALRQAYGAYAQAAGTDTAGFDSALAAGNITGGAGSGSVADLAAFLNPQAQELRNAEQAQGERGIQVGSQARLRELAPMFGYDPLEAEGKFQAGEGNDLARAGALGKQEDYVENGFSGGTSRAEQDAAEAEALGFDPKVYGGLKSSTKMSGQDIATTVQGEDFKVMQNSVDEFIAAGGDKPDKKGINTRTGLDGFRQFVAEKAKGLVHEDGTPFSAKEITDFIDVTTSLNNGRLSRIYGKGEEE